MGSPNRHLLVGRAVHVSIQPMARSIFRFGWMLAFAAAMFVAVKAPAFMLKAADEGLFSTATCSSISSDTSDQAPASTPGLDRAHCAACGSAGHALALPTDRPMRFEAASVRAVFVSDLSAPTRNSRFGQPVSTGPPSPLV